MRYEDARRLSGVESAWLRLKFWFRPVFPQAGPVISDLGAPLGSRAARYRSSPSRSATWIGEAGPLAMDWHGP